MITERLQALRKEMLAQNIDAYIIPSSDPHQSEYVADHWKVRAYFSGFTGSAGTLVITKDKAALWTDSRYFLQVEEECANSEVTLYKQTIPHAPEHIPWLCETLENNTVIGIDFRQFSKAQVDYLQEFATPKNIQLQHEATIVDTIWKDRPSMPSQPIEEHLVVFSGETTASKLSKVKNEIQRQKAGFYFFSSLDEIAWLFNIRSNDVDFTPLVTAYALVDIDKTILFCYKERFSEELLQQASELQIEIYAYDTVLEHLPALTANQKVITDDASLNYAIFNAIAERFIFQNSIAQQLKAIKNSVEIEGAKKCILKDGIALTKFFIWLEKEVEKRSISEYEIGEKLTHFRQQQAHYTGNSFAPIVGYKGNGAIIHYSATKEGAALVQNEGILLIDSGGQYKDGTTDITRTIWLGGTPSDTIKMAYTAVLKGYISLEQLQFPLGTTGVQIDAFARMHLWKHGMNYPHGTGHGIGSYGMVHEPAQGFATSTTTSRGSTVHQPNQLTTIEPGYYVTDEFGIRIENIVLSKVTQTTDFGTFLGFEPLTLCYVDTTLINIDSLTKEEVQWLNTYHAFVLQELTPHLTAEEHNWLADKCKAISLS